MEYRRTQVSGGRFLFTVVTYERRKIFSDEKNINILRNVFSEIKNRYEFTIDAIVILPDHIHCIWTLPEGIADFSTPWRLIKSSFSRRCDPGYKIRASRSRIEKKEQPIWQRRFWEHYIRSDEDFMRHVEYIHYNPVKHGIVDAPRKWRYSSFHKYVNKRFYDAEWGAYKEMTFPSDTGKE